MRNDRSPEISVCICTYKRPELLRKCLDQVLNQTTSHSYEVVVVDNDDRQSAQPTIDAVKAAFSERGIKLQYLVEPKQNISLARNCCVSTAEGSCVACIDDDEYPTNRWLENLWETMKKYRATAVFGPVVPVFTEKFPAWIRNDVIFNQSTVRMATGTVPRRGVRSSNFMINRIALHRREGPFRIDYGITGGEDSEFFNWLCKSGAKFFWCDEAIVYEIQEGERELSVVGISEEDTV